MSDPNIYKEYAATPGETLEQYIMDPCGSKTEHEWWASREITRLRKENEKLREALSNAAGELRHAYIMGFTERYRDAAKAARAAAAAIWESGDE